MISRHVRSLRHSEGCGVQKLRPNDIYDEILGPPPPPQRSPKSTIFSNSSSTPSPMATVQTSNGGASPSLGVDAQTQTDRPSAPIPPSEALRAKEIRSSYKPPHQLSSPDASYAGSAALLAAQHTSSPAAWTFDGNANSSAAAALARANSKPSEAWKPDKLSSAGAAASLAHRSSISERNPIDKSASASAAAALRSPTRSSLSFVGFH